MTELEIIDGLRQKFGTPGRGVIVGIGDDCAVFRPRGGREDLVFTTDQLIEDVHFRQGTPPSKAGAKALARALSDIAAMGADPRFCLISLAAPPAFDIEGFYRGLGSIARRYNLIIAGGDMAKTRAISCDVVVCGAVPRGKALLRSGARPGDHVYVSGPLGRAAARNYRDLPEPRIAFGKRLRGRATACMDISDGLSIDLYRLCQASGVGVRIDTVPVARRATEAQALHGGEDYELLYTGPEGLPGIRIGEILPDAGSYPLQVKGWDHFA